MKRIFGKLLYKIFKVFPASDSKFNLFGKRLRNFSCKLFFDKCGKKINIDRNAIIGNHIVIGDYSGIGRDSVVSDYVTIGNHVMMGPECLIYTRNHNYSSTKVPMCFQGFNEYKPVVIGDDVWIGGRVIILPGVKVGKGSVIGAGSIVTKDVEPYSIVAGNPAKKIKKRK